MRVVVLGGTRFIGRRIVERLVRRGDSVLVVHRGHSEPAGWVEVEHLHVDRAELARFGSVVEAFAPDAVVDTYALTAGDVDAVLPVLPEVKTVVLSSQDVYLAYDGLRHGRRMAATEITERSPLRRQRYPYRDADPDLRDYEKLDVEDRWLPRGAVVLRLPVVYGPHDERVREDFVLRRVRAGRREIPIGPADLRWSRMHVDDAASAVIAALDCPAARGKAINVAEAATDSVGVWMHRILAAAGSDATLVRVPDSVLPEDLWWTRRHPQHLCIDPARASALLGWTPGEPAARVAESVDWHLRHPAKDTWTEEAARADDAALANARQLAAKPTPA